MYRVRYARPATSLSGTFFQTKKTPSFVWGGRSSGFKV